MKAKELAQKINAHLKRFEADPEINKPRNGTTLTPYWHAGAGDFGRWISVVYIGYQRGTLLSRQDAERYLEWLDAGNIGRHYEALEAPRQP